MNSSLSVATYNIEYSRRPQLLIKTIVQMIQNGVNVFCFQEILRLPENEFIVDVLLKELGKNWKLEYFVGDEGNYLDVGVGILWNESILKLQKIEKINLPKMKKYPLLDRLVLRSVGFIDTPLQNRAIVGTFSLNDHSLRITSLRLDTVGGTKNRIKQAKYMLDFIKDKPKVEYEIICGDFNTIDPLKAGKEVQTMRGLFDIYSFTDATKDIVWSADIYNSDFGKKPGLVKKVIKHLNVHVRRKLDYIWSKNLQIISSQKIDSTASDHYPIVTNFAPISLHFEPKSQMK